MDKRKAGIAFLLLGAVLILSALLLFLFNRKEDSEAGRQAGLALQEVQEVLMDDSGDVADGNSTEATSSPTETTEGSAEMTVVTIDGRDYIGYLSIPELELELPVISQWSYELLQIAPCRDVGSTKTDDLVIAAHNYQTHFGRLKELSEGDSVVFTDMDGVVIEYELTKVETIDPHKVDYVHNSDHDLVLYTCTIGGEYRVVAFCDRVVDEKG